ncbi:hypothetical protein PMAYCL1PPCAC_19806, partial [Pristionchus mayeri]
PQGDLRDRWIRRAPSRHLDPQRPREEGMDRRGRCGTRPCRWSLHVDGARQGLERRTTTHLIHIFILSFILSITMHLNLN